MSSSLTPLITVAVRGLVVKHGKATPPQAWEDVARIDFSRFPGWFVMRDASGNRVRIRGLLSGVSELAEILECRHRARAAPVLPSGGAPR
ncbi:MAG: hypothetical protein U1F36_20850 [Planctomycetota bacterium]